MPEEPGFPFDDLLAGGGGGGVGTTTAGQYSDYDWYERYVQWLRELGSNYVPDYNSSRGTWQSVMAAAEGAPGEPSKEGQIEQQTIGGVLYQRVYDSESGAWGQWEPVPQSYIGGGSSGGGGTPSVVSIGGYDYEVTTGHDGKPSYNMIGKSPSGTTSSGGTPNIQSIGGYDYEVTTGADGKPLYNMIGRTSTTGTGGLSPGDQTQLDEDKRQFDLRMAWEREQAAQQAATAKETRLAQLAAQGPGSWLEYALQAGQTPVGQDWMLGKSAIGPQASPLIAGITRGEALPGWTPPLQSTTGGGVSGDVGTGGTGQPPIGAFPAPSAGAVSGGAMPGGFMAPGLDQGQTTQLAGINQRIIAGGILTPEEEAIAKQWLTGSYQMYLAKRASAPTVPAPVTPTAPPVTAQPQPAPSGPGPVPVYPNQPPISPSPSMGGEPQPPPATAPPPTYGTGGSGAVTIDPTTGLPIGWFANGGIYWGDRPAVVGEQGPELMTPTSYGGTQITPLNSNMGGGTDTPVPKNNLLPSLTPSRQYQARMSPDELAQYYAYIQMQTGRTPQAEAWRLDQWAPGGGVNRGLSYARR